MSDVHILLDVFRMWLVVKVYKKAMEHKPGGPKMYVFIMLLLEAKYKFVGVTHQFNDCFMIVFALMAIYAWQHGSMILSSILFGIAVNIKMSALLLLRGYLLTVSF